MSDDPSDRTGSPAETDRGTANEETLDPGFDVRELSSLVSDHAATLFDSDGTVVTWNDGIRRLTGYVRADIVGSHYRVFFPAEAREAGVPDRLLERARSAGKSEHDGWRIGSDGRRFWVHDVIAPIREDGTVPIDDPIEDDVLRGYAWFVQDRTESHERERELREEKAFVDSILAAQPDILYAFDTELNLIEWNDRFERVFGYDPDELTGMHPLRFIASPDREHIAAAIDRILEEDERVTAEGRILTSDGSRIPYEFNSATITGDDGTVHGFTGIGRDIRERKARERELERLERVNAIIRAIDETLVAAETRDEIETTVVEEFAAADGYQFAIIGRGDPVATIDNDPWEPATQAGIDATASEEVFSLFVDPPDDASGESPFETRTVQRYRTLRESAVNEWQSDACDRGYGSVAVVPIVATDRLLGALVIAADEPSAFVDGEREALQEFGGTIGHAINAMAVRRLLYRDTVIELEFESTDRGDVCIELSQEAGCDLSIDHVLPLTDEVFIFYLTVSGIDSDVIRDLVGEIPDITELRLIDAGGEESYWEAVVRDSTITELLGEYGARLQSQVVRDGVAELTVQVSPDTNLRELVGAITSVYPDTRLVSKRTADRPVETRSDFRRSVESALTEKQQLALEAAYHGGYFEWPTRNSDAGEVADRLGIARQTFHQHLRVAQAKVLSAYFGTID